MAQWLRRAGFERWDLGSIPRSPQNSILFFLACLCAGFQRASYHAPHKSTRHVSIITDPKARDGRSWCSSVNMHVDKSGSQTQAWQPMGLEIAKRPSNLAQTPLGFAFHFFIILFSLFHLLYSYLLFFYYYFINFILFFVNKL